MNQINFWTSKLCLTVPPSVVKALALDIYVYFIFQWLLLLLRDSVQVQFISISEIIIKEV